MKSDKINEQKKIFEEINKKREEELDSLKRPFTNDELIQYINNFKSLTWDYYNKLINLNSLINGHWTISQNKNVDKQSVENFSNEVFQQTIRIKQSKLMADNYVYNEIIKLLNLTDKEQEILKYIYLEKLDYNTIYKNKLLTTKRTYDDHLKRMVKKLYEYTEKEKESFPYLKHLFPEYKTKEDESGQISTYAEPFKTLQKFLSQF